MAKASTVYIIVDLNSLRQYLLSVTA
jgi:hypothetical protein